MVLFVLEILDANHVRNDGGFMEQEFTVVLARYTVYYNIL